MCALRKVEAKEKDRRANAKSVREKKKLEIDVWDSAESLVAAGSSVWLVGEGWKWCGQVGV